MERMPENLSLNHRVQEKAKRLHHYDSYTFGHSQRVALLSVQIGERFSWSSKRLKRLCVAALLHDVGKLFVPKTILNKPSHLTLNERKLIRSHTVLGYYSLYNLCDLNGVKEFVLFHHERYDGLGYPFGLKKECIPLESRIIMVADTFDAMTSHRVYNRASSFENGILEINQQVNRMFDPRVIDHFNRVVKNYHEYINPSIHRVV